MRLGTILMIVGVIAVVSGLLMSAGHYETRTVVTDYGLDTQQTYQPNLLRPFVLGLGGFLFSGGFGGWVGTYDADQRRRRGD